MEGRISGWMDGYADECRVRSRLYWPIATALELIQGVRLLCNTFGSTIDMVVETYLCVCFVDAKERGIVKS